MTVRCLLLAHSGHCQEALACCSELVEMPEDRAMRVNGTGIRIGVAVLALGLSVFAMSTAPEAQKAAGIARVGWLEVCGPGPKRPHFDISELAWRS